MKHKLLKALGITTVAGLTLYQIKRLYDHQTIHKLILQNVKDMREPVQDVSGIPVGIPAHTINEDEFAYVIMFMYNLNEDQLKSVTWAKKLYTNKGFVDVSPKVTSAIKDAIAAGEGANVPTYVAEILKSLPADHKKSLPRLFETRRAQQALHRTIQKLQCKVSQKKKHKRKNKREI